MTELCGATEWKDVWTFINTKNHVDQAKWWLNCFWDEKEGGKDNAVEIYDWTQKFIELDIGIQIKIKRKKKVVEEDAPVMGCDLDEMKAHRFIELTREAITVVKMRKLLKEADLDFNKRMSLSEYLIYHFKKDPKVLCNEKRQICGDMTAINAAQAEMDAVNAGLQAAQDAEAAVAEAQEESRKCVAELDALKKARADKIAALEAKTEDPALGVVKKNRARAELAQVKDEDPLPMRQAKISSEAALRKVTKQRKKAVGAVLQLQAEFAKAKQSLEDLSTGGTNEGLVFWMQQELKEAEKFMPKKKKILG